ncbi:MAG: carboxypeptidase regulatory-like domain-containing protein [Planctomycetes bacterium]|nr:carboxypeptidase regulatory-like domain-containing protein [Planctomycetota bacterium]
MPHPAAISAGEGKFELPGVHRKQPLLALLPGEGFGYTPAWEPEVPIRITKHRGVTLRLVERKLGPPPVVGAKVHLRRLALIHDATNQLLPEGRKEYRALSHIERLAGHTDASGIVTFAGVPEGVFEAHIEVSPTQKLTISPLVFSTEEMLTIPIGESGRISLTVIRRDTNAPIPTASARAMDLDPPFPSITPWIKTDDQGVVQLDGPIRGFDRVQAIVRAKGFATESIILPEVATESHVARTVSLEPGRDLGSVIQDSEGKPIAGAQILAQSPADRVFERVWSNDEGKFAIPSAPQSRATKLVISKPGFVTSEIVVEPSKPAPSPILLQRAGQIILEIDGLPTKTESPDRKVSVWLRFDDLSGAAGVSQQFDVSNRCDAPIDLPVDSSGRYLVRVQCSERAPQNVFADVREGIPTKVHVNLRSGTTVRGRVIAGRERTPIANAFIQVILPRRLNGSVGTPSGVSINTDADGRFTLENAAPGALELLFIDGDRAGRQLEFLVPEKSDHDIGVIELYRFPRLSGRILSEGNLPSDVYVKVRDHASVERAGIPVQRDGSFSAAGILKGNYSLSVGVRSDPSFETGRLFLVIGDDEDKKVTLRYGPANLRCKIAPTFDDPSQEWELTVRSYGTGGVIGSRDGRGDASLEVCGMPTGKVQIVVRTWGSKRTTLLQQPAELRSGWNDIALQRSGSELKVTVRDRSGEALPGASVTSYRDSRSGFNAAVRTDLKGEVILRDMTAGSYLLGVVKNGFERVPRTRVELRDGSSSDVEIRVLRESPLAVILRDPRGQPVAGATVRVERNDTLLGESYFYDSDGQGAARFESLGAGPHKIRVLSGPNLFPLEKMIELAADQALEVPITVRRLGAVRIRVIDKSGASVAGAAPIVQVDGVDGDSNSWLADGICESATGAAETGPDGVLEIRRLPEGKATIAVEGTAPWLTSIEPDKTTDALLRQN